MKKEKITLLAVGDVVIDRDNPETIFSHVAHVLRAGDITFANLDQNYSDERQPSRIHTMPSDPKNISALVYTGFDVVSLANNHTLDWGPEALLDSIDRLRRAGIPTVGVGHNITEARRPVIIERNGVHVGFLAYNCIGPRGYEADEENAGHASIRALTLYEQVDYQPATFPRIVSFADRDDLHAMTYDIRRLKDDADVIVVSFHWGIHFVPRVIPMYEFEIGHAAVCAGADLVLGTHAHILKGIEVYKGKVIFHGMSNFAYELRGINTPKFMLWLKEHYGFEPEPEYPVYIHPEAKATLIAKVIIEEAEIKKVSYLPCYINKNSEPEIVSRADPRGQEVYHYVESISQSEKLATKFSWEGDEVLISA